MMTKADTDCGGEMADAEHTYGGSSVFHAWILPAWCRRRTLQICCVYREMQCRGAAAPNPRQSFSVRPEAERLGCDAHFDEECAERGGETHHGRHEQDGYGSRQVDRDEGGCEKRHHNQRHEQCGYRTER